MVKIGEFCTAEDEKTDEKYLVRCRDGGIVFLLDIKEKILSNPQTTCRPQENGTGPNDRRA